MRDPASTTDPAPETGALRVRLVQPALAKYRLPVFAEFASRPGIDLHVAYSDDGKVPGMAPEGFEGSFHRRRRLGGFTLSGFEWSQASRRRADVVLLPWTTRELMLVPTMLRARAAGIGVALWGHGYSKRESGWRRRLRNGVTSLAHTVVLYNRSAADGLIAAGLDASRAFVAPNALDQTPIQAARDACLADPDALEAFQRENGLLREDGSKRPVVLFVSRLERDNRVDLLLRAAARLRSDAPDLTVAIIGKGEALDELRALAGELGIEGSTRFTGAIYGEEALAPWFCSSDVFCYPANIGLSILHAMGYALPIVTSARREAQNPEIEALVDGENGLTYPDGDMDAFVDALRRVLTDTPLRDRLSRASHQTATERYALSRMVDGLEACVRAAAARRA